MGASPVSQQCGDNSGTQERAPALPVICFSQPFLRWAFAGHAGEEGSFVWTSRKMGGLFSVGKVPVFHTTRPKGKTPPTPTMEGSKGKTFRAFTVCLALCFCILVFFFCFSSQQSCKADLKTPISAVALRRGERLLKGRAST